MLTVGEQFPEYSLKACVTTEIGKEFITVSNSSFIGKWKIIFFWPLDFTFVCPTEIAGFSSKLAEFEKRNTTVLGFSVDSHYVHLGWRKADERLLNVAFPMVSDLKRDLATKLGIIHPKEGVPVRATFIVDPEGIIRYVSAHDLPTGRNVDEVIRTLDALQSGGLCPVNWKSGDATLL